jgi:hypothetical protein
MYTVPTVPNHQKEFSFLKTISRKWVILKKGKITNGGEMKDEG